jgi:hypothetical protein
VNNIPKRLRDELSKDKYYRNCLRLVEGNCQGRITWEHSEMYSGRQIQERWAIIPLCVYHHLGIGLNKRMNKWFAVNRMTEEDEKKYPRVDWKLEREILNKLFGKNYVEGTSKSDK